MCVTMEYIIRLVLFMQGLYSHFPSDSAKAHTVLAEIANNPRIWRKVMVYSSPFVSSSELKETVIGEHMLSV